MEQPHSVPGVVHGSCVNQDLGYTSRWYLSVLRILHIQRRMVYIPQTGKTRRKQGTNFNSSRDGS